MRYIFSLVFLLSVTLSATSQQINPVPDYIFRNSMSVGRNAPTDTSAYFSIGPRFGATRGFMPPMVVDTSAVTGTKRNGLLIYSIQRNSFLYWDSTGSRWSRIAANLDTLQLATRAWRQKGDDSLSSIINTRTDTLLLSTRAWRQKGIDSVANVRVGGTGTTNYVPKFTASGTIGNSQIFDNGTRVGINTTSPLRRLQLDVAPPVTEDDGLIVTDTSRRFQFARTGFSYSYRDAPPESGLIYSNDNIASLSDGGYQSWHTSGGERMRLTSAGLLGIGTISPASILHVSSDASNIRKSNASGTTYTEHTNDGLIATGTSLTLFAPTSQSLIMSSGNGEAARFNANKRLLVNTTTDAGYLVDVNGTLRTVNGADFATSSGNVGIGTTASKDKLGVVGSIAKMTLSGYDGTFDNIIKYGFKGQLEGTGADLLKWHGIDGTISSGPGSDNKMKLRVYSGTSSGSPLDVMTLTGAGNVGIGTTSPSYTLDVTGTMRNTTSAYFSTSSGESYVGTTTDVGDFKLQVSGVTYSSDGLRTGNPNGGTAATWKLGTVASVSPTSPNRTIEVDIGGTIYYIHAKTTND